MKNIWFATIFMKFCAARKSTKKSLLPIICSVFFYSIPCALSVLPKKTHVFIRKRKPSGLLVCGFAQRLPVRCGGVQSNAGPQDSAMA